MKKNLLYTALGLMGIIGTLSIGVVNADCWSDNGATAPDSNSTYASGIVYGCDENNIPVITIYGENSNGDSVGITIKAMNEGTGTVKIGSGTDADSFGSIYQRGNNYPFPNTADTTTPINFSNNAVSAEGYGPGTTNGYYDSNLRINGVMRDSSDNRNLWGGSGDKKNLNGFWGFDIENFEVINATGRQAMCPEGYHIPSAGERNALLYLRGKNYDKKQGTLLFNIRNLSNFNRTEFGGIGIKISEDIQTPMGARRDSSNYAWNNRGGSYWTSSPDNFDSSREISFDERTIWTDMNQDRAKGYSVRCFKNFYIELPQTFNLFFMSDDKEVGTGEVTENMTGAIPEKAKNVTKTGYILEYRYLSGADTSTGFDFENTPISGAWADENNNVYFIAQWTPITYSVEFTGTDVEGTMLNQEFTYGIAQNLTANTFTKNGYTFSGWTDGTTGYTDGQEVVNLTTTSGDVITLTAEWTKIETKPSGGSSGGGGRKNKTSDTQDSSAMPQNDNKSSSGTEVKDLRGDTQDSSANVSEGQNQQQFTKEFQEAYEFAKEKGITTMPTINDANMNGKLTRIAMAKMLSYYAINVLGQKPDETRINKFNDITEKLDAQYDSGVTLAYQLGIMGINMPNNIFRPNDEVTRAEFATALSRMLYGTPDGKPYYTTHLQKLKAEGILTNDDYKMKELRGYVMIMLKRSAK